MARRAGVSTPGRAATSSPRISAAAGLGSSARGQIRAPSRTGDRNTAPITLNLPNKPVVYPERVRGETVPGRRETARPSKPILPETGRVPGGFAPTRPASVTGLLGPDYYPGYASGSYPYSAGYGSYYGAGYDPYYGSQFSTVSSPSYYGGYRVSTGPYSSYAAGYDYPYYTPASGYTYSSSYVAPSATTAVRGVDVRRSGYAPVSAGASSTQVQARPDYDATAAAYEAGYQRSQMEATYQQAEQPERPQTYRRGQTLEK